MVPNRFQQLSRANDSTTEGGDRTGTTPNIRANKNQHLDRQAGGCVCVHALKKEKRRRRRRRQRNGRRQLKQQQKKATMR